MTKGGRRVMNGHKSRSVWGQRQRVDRSYRHRSVRPGEQVAHLLDAECTPRRLSERLGRGEWFCRSGIGRYDSPAFGHSKKERVTEGLTNFHLTNRSLLKVRMIILYPIRTGRKPNPSGLECGETCRECRMYTVVGDAVRGESLGRGAPVRGLGLHPSHLDGNAIAEIANRNIIVR